VDPCYTALMATVREIYLAGGSDIEGLDIKEHLAVAVKRPRELPELPGHKNFINSPVAKTRLPDVHVSGYLSASGSPVKQDGLSLEASQRFAHYFYSGLMEIWNFSVEKPIELRNEFLVLLKELASDIQRQNERGPLSRLQVVYFIVALQHIHK